MKKKLETTHVETFDEGVFFWPEELLAAIPN